MISVSTPLTNLINQGLSAKVSARVIAEWNHNRHSTVATVDNWGSAEANNGFDLEIYPISSIVKPLRPTTGILIAKTNEGSATSGYEDDPVQARSYTASPDNQYKHWTSQVQSNGSGAIASSGASPYVIYTAPVWTNKIYLCFEITASKPTTYTVSTTTDGTTWTTVATSPAVASDGTVALYLQPGGSWSSTPNYTNSTQLLGVKVSVTNLNNANAFLNVVEMGLRLQQDVSTLASSYSVDMEMSDESIVVPIGDLSSNDGNLTLSNVDGRFNNDAPSGTDPFPTYRGLIDENVLFTIDLGFDTTPFGGSGIEYVRQGTMYSDTWTVDDESAQVVLKDSSKFLQELKPPALLMQDVTIGQAIWRMLDAVGFNSYRYSRAADAASTQIAFFWTDPAKTVWDTMQEICRDTQTAAYFDAFNVLQIRTRDDAYDSTKSTTQTFNYAPVGLNQPNIVSFSENPAYQVNKVTVTYQETGLATDTSGRPTQETLWQPDGDVVLRAATLRDSMTNSQMYFYLKQREASYWPYSGLVNIRGELIKYDGKQYRYIDKSGNWQYRQINSVDEKSHVDNDLSSSNYSWRNYFTGKMIVTERGVDWTSPAAHDTTIQPWRDAGPAYGSASGSQTTWTGGIHHLKDESIMRLRGKAGFSTGTFYCAPHGAVSSQPPNTIGTRFRFPSNPHGKEQIGGIFFYSNSAMTSMYCVEIISTAWLAKNNRKGTAHEVRIMKRDSGNYTSLVGKGETHLIASNVWHDLDVSISGGTFSVTIDGIVVPIVGSTHPILNITDNSLPSTSKLGLYIRGNTVMDFEYFYYDSGNSWPADDPDNTGYLDLIRGGYYSQQFYRNGYFRTHEAKRKRGKRTITYKTRYAQRFFDEFGMQIHEVRDFTVTFDKSPVVYSDVYFNSTDQVVILDYTGNPFGSTFTMANASRTNAVLNGDDNITFGSGNTVTRQLIVTGRTVQQKEQAQVVKQDDAAIAKRGEITLDFGSNWVQTKAAAEALANWCVTKWATPADEIDLEIFANPLVEVCDKVGLNYAPRNIAGHQYFITKIGHSWDSGPTTTISLRRAT